MAEFPPLRRIDHANCELRSKSVNGRGCSHCARSSERVHRLAMVPRRVHWRSYALINRLNTGSPPFQTTERDQERTPTMKKDTPLKVIREKCLDCTVDNKAEVRLCQVTNCPIWSWRFGKRPETVAARRPELLDPAFILEKGGVARVSDTGEETDPEAGSSPRRSESRAYSTKQTLDRQCDPRSVHLTATATTDSYQGGLSR